MALRIPFLLLVAILAMPAAASGDPVPSDALWLVTPDEASTEDAPALRASKTKVEDGPLIQIESPELETEVASPLNLVVKFIENRSPVEVKSLKVTLVKLVKIDLTKRVREFVTSEGIDIQGAKLPSGKHRVRIALSDTEGRTTSVEVKIRVK